MSKSRWAEIKYIHLTCHWQAFLFNKAAGLETIKKCIQLQSELRGEAICQVLRLVGIMIAGTLQ